MMEYTVNKLALLSGVSVRTLHYYDQIGLLRPERTDTNGYRIYSAAQVDRLQMILFYRELGFKLEEITALLDCSDFDRQKSLESHLLSLENKKAQIELLISNVKKTIKSEKGETVMSDSEKFEGFKKKAIEENEKKYGKELRERFGDEAIDASVKKMSGMTKGAWDRKEDLSEKINEQLKIAMKTGDTTSPEAKKLCELHREWLCMYWADGTYSKEAHLALADGYLADERFRSYYDKVADGAAQFLRDAIAEYCNA